MSYFAYIESVRQVVDHNPSPPGLHHMSLIIKTPERELKFTAQSKERREYWFQALNYLLQRPEDSMQNGAAAPGQQNQLSNQQQQHQQQQQQQSSIPSSPGGNKPTKTNIEAWDGQSDARNLNINNSSQNGDNNIREIKKKSSFSKLQSIFRRDGTGAGAAAYSSPTSPIESHHHNHNYHNHNDDVDSDDEDLENVRQCCDGKHDIGKLEHHKHF
jgi:hypothetical protein